MGVLYKQDEIETRCLRTSEVRVEGDVKPKITGYAAVFDTWADIGGYFKESIKRGAFTRTIKEADVRALMNHNENYVLGRNKSGTLKLHEDSRGLAVEIDPAPTTWANDLITSMRRGDVSQMSFGFTVNQQEINYDTDERTLTDVTLFDVSVVTYPAYPTTSAQVRSLFKPRVKEESKWDKFDIISGKIKAGEVLTEEEVRQLMSYLPAIPPEPQIAVEVTPPEKQEITAKRQDKYMELLTKIEKTKRSI